jgi:ribosomal protein S18 acetylase RimI-like enzyme
MNFVWHDYDPKSMGYIEDWLDEAAVKSTGLDEGFRAFYEAWANEDGFVVGENFWCKVVFQNDKPFAVIAFCQYECKITIMEIVVDPEKRGLGRGSKLLKELLESEEIIGCAIHQSEAVIYPDNTASQKAFEKAGFRYHHTHEDGNGKSMYYVYARSSNK